MRSFFILIFLFSELLILDNKQIYAQYRILESFEGNEFPPDGWSVINSQPGEGEWKSSERMSNSGSKCAISNFSLTGSNNILVTKSFTPLTGDSLVFHFRQTFWRFYKDTLNVLISNTDSLFNGTSERLFQMMDSVSYAVPFGYVRKSISLNNYTGQKVWLGFQHINLNGENIRIDDISVSRSNYSDVSVVSNLYPLDNISICTDANIIPSAVIGNYGTVNQIIPFSITYSVTGPVNFQRVKLDTLSSGITKEITFDTIQVNVPGNYQVKIYTSVSGDQDPVNDTLHSAFSVINPNFGGGLASGGNYYFANSSSCSMNAMSLPEFCRKDTSGSISLILNNEDMTDGLLTGNADDGYFSLGSLLPPGNSIKFFDSEYDSVFISTNGVIGFINDNMLLSPDPSGVDNLMVHPVPLFSPLWIDLDFSNSIVTENRLSYKIAGNQLIINYDKAPLKSGSADSYVSFQVIIEFGTSLIQNSKLIVQYDQLSSGEEFISKYNNNTLPSHLVGLKSISGNEYLHYRFKDSSELITAGPLFNSSLALEFGPDESRLDNKCSQFDISVLLEAIYPERDTISVIIRDTRPPFAVLETEKYFPDSNGTGTGYFSIPSEQYRYYIQISHRNSIETWSRDSGEYFSSFHLDYDFSSNPSMAYGNNMCVKNGRSFIYCGDVNQDDIVDGDDLLSTYNAGNNFVTGYMPEDINNDRVIDLDDLVFLYNNSINFVEASNP